MLSDMVHHDLLNEDILQTPRLRPHIHPSIQNFLKEKNTIFGLMERYSSPLNLIFPQNIHDNIRSFQDVYKKNSLRGRIYYSSKPCKSLALYREGASADIGIDVSSPNSLKAALECGWDTDRIGATGPKNKAYIETALQNDVLINVDNVEELIQIAAIHSTLNPPHKARVSVRISDYGLSKKLFLGESDSTFGIRSADMEYVFSYLKSNPKIFKLVGFSWHSSAARDEQRIAAIENLLSLTYMANQKGLSPSSINIGGGFPIMHADSCKEWADYIIAIKSAVMGKIPPQTWNGNGLGFRNEKGALSGGAMFMDHAPFDARGEDLERRLNYRLPSFGNARFADIVRDSLLSLSIEPGAAMVDQCGITLGRVEYTKTSAHGETLVGLGMNRSNLHSDHYKILCEPVILTPDTGRPANAGNKGVYYIGNLCLSYDMLQYNKTYPNILPQTGDIVAFMNTAPYRMDFTESETLMQSVAQKIAVTNINDKWECVPDEDYRISK